LCPATDKSSFKKKVKELTAIKVFIQAPHKTRFTSAQRDEFLDSVYNVE
jgi:hypothetical protein